MPDENRVLSGRGEGAADGVGLSVQDADRAQADSGGTRDQAGPSCSEPDIDARHHDDARDEPSLFAVEAGPHAGAVPGLADASGAGSAGVDQSSNPNGQVVSLQARFSGDILLQLSLPVRALYLDVVAARAGGLADKRYATACLLVKQRFVQTWTWGPRWAVIYKLG